MKSDMSMRTRASASPNRNSASVLATSVFPTPVGPRNTNEPSGRRAEDRPVRDRRMADAITEMASSWPMTFLCSSSSMRSSFCDSLCTMRASGMPVMSEMTCWMSSTSTTFSSTVIVLSQLFLISSTLPLSWRTMSRTAAAFS